MTDNAWKKRADGLWVPPTQPEPTKVQRVEFEVKVAGFKPAEEKKR